MSANSSSNGSPRYSSSSTFRTFSHGIEGAEVRSLGELLLVELGVLGRQELGVDERGELPHLHRRTLHLAEDRGHLHRRLEMAGLEPPLGRLARRGRRSPPWSPRSGSPAPPIADPSFAERRILPLGILSSAMPVRVDDASRAARLCHGPAGPPLHSYPPAGHGL